MGVTPTQGNKNQVNRGYRTAYSEPNQTSKRERFSELSTPKNGYLNSP